MVLEFNCSEPSMFKGQPETKVKFTEIKNDAT
jgi:hypothetical protein